MGKRDTLELFDVFEQVFLFPFLFTAFAHRYENGGENAFSLGLWLYWMNFAFEF